MTLQDSTKPVREFRFGNCRVVLPLREIWRGTELVAAEPKVFDLLAYLIRHRDRAVSKNELQDHIWPDAIVTEASLTRCVMKARRCIADESGADAITTVRGHGYRFAHDVTEITDELRNDDTEDTRGKEDTTATPLSLPDKPSLVVLPLVNLSNDPAQEYFSDGITEDIITELSRFRSLFVIGRQSAFSFKQRNLTTRRIAAELGVAYVVDGSLQRRGERLRFTIRLVDASNDAQLWAERYDRDIGDILVVQEEVARTVAATIGGRVEATRGRQRIDSNRFRSYDRLLQAQALYYEFSKIANAKARRLLEEAIAIDPENARALAILAAVHSMDSWSFWVEDIELSQQRSLEFGKRSIAADDTDSLAHALFAEILSDCDQPELSEHHFRRALDLNPNDIAAHALYASKLRAMGRIDEAIDHIGMAKRLDPFGLLWIPLIEGTIMFAAKRYAESADALYSMTSPPNEARFILMAALGQLGRIDEALRVREAFFQLAREEMPNFPGEALHDWQPVFERMLGSQRRADIEHVIDSLRLIGWDQ